MRILRKYILLLGMVILASCDPGCISSDSVGINTTNNATVYADPFDIISLRANIVPKAITCDGTKSTTKFTYWTPLNTTYDDNKTYGMTVIGGVSFCGVDDDFAHDSSLEMWLDASQISGKNNDDPIDIWTDKKNSYNAIQNSTLNGGGFTSSSSMRPVYKKDIFGVGRPAIYFDGSDDFLAINNLSSVMNSDHTIIMVIKDLTAGTLWATNVFNQYDNDIIYLKNGTLEHKSDAAVSGLLSGDITTSVNVVVIKRDSNISSKVNGRNILPAKTSRFYNDTNRVSIGQDWNLNIPSNFLRGYIGEILIFSRILPDSDIKNYEDYLMIKWGIKSCAERKNLSDLRLRIGNKESNQSLFDATGAFTIPSDLNSATGSMYIRVKESSIDTNACTMNYNQIKDEYQNNIGSYNVRLTIDSGSASTGIVGGIYSKIVQPVQNILTNDVQKHFYDSIVGTSTNTNTLFQKILRLSLTLFISFTAISYLMGLVEMSKADLLMRILKIGFIYALLAPGSWEMFNQYLVGFFQDGALDLATSITNAANASFTGSSSTSSGGEVVFYQLDTIFNMIISGDINAKVLGLLFFPPFTGFLMVIMIYYAFYIFLHIIVKVLIIYISIFVMMTFLFVVAPVFFIFLLFERTKSFFAKWLDMLIGYSFQLIMLGVVASLFSWIILAVMYDLFNYTVCWKPVIFCCHDTPFNFTVLEFYRLSTFDYTRFDPGAKSSMGPNIFSVALFFFLVDFFKRFLGFAMDLSARIAGGASISNLAGSISNLAGSIEGDVKSLPKNAMKKVDSALSNSRRYREAKRNIREKINAPLRAADRALFGKRQQSENNLIKDIQNQVKEGHKEAASSDKNINREEHIRNSVRGMLERKGMSDAKINKIMNSGQLAKDIKNSRLQTKDVKDMMNKTYVDNYNKSYEENIKNMSESEAKDAAASVAQEATDKLKANIGKDLAKDGASDRQNYGFKAKMSQDKFSSNYKPIEKIGRGLQTVKRGVQHGAGAIAHNAKSGINELTGQSAENRLKNFANAARQIEKKRDLENQKESRGFMSLKAVSDSMKLSMIGVTPKRIGKAMLGKENNKEYERQKEIFMSGQNEAASKIAKAFQNYKSQNESIALGDEGGKAIEEQDLAVATADRDLGIDDAGAVADGADAAAGGGGAAVDGVDAAAGVGGAAADGAAAVSGDGGAAVDGADAVSGDGGAAADGVDAAAGGGSTAADGAAAVSGGSGAAADGAAAVSGDGGAAADGAAAVSGDGGAAADGVDAAAGGGGVAADGAAAAAVKSVASDLVGNALNAGAIGAASKFDAEQEAAEDAGAESEQQQEDIVALNDELEAALSEHLSEDELQAAEDKALGEDDTSDMRRLQAEELTAAILGKAEDGAAARIDANREAEEEAAVKSVASYLVGNALNAGAIGAASKLDEEQAAARAAEEEAARVAAEAEAARAAEAEAARAAEEEAARVAEEEAARVAEEEAARVAAEAEAARAAAEASAREKPQKRRKEVSPAERRRLADERKAAEARARKEVRKKRIAAATAKATANMSEREKKAYEKHFIKQGMEQKVANEKAEQLHGNKVANEKAEQLHGNVELGKNKRVMKPKKDDNK